MTRHCLKRGVMLAAAFMSFVSSSHAATITGTHAQWHFGGALSGAGSTRTYTEIGGIPENGTARPNDTGAFPLLVNGAVSTTNVVNGNDASLYVDGFANGLPLSDYLIETVFRPTGTQGTGNSSNLAVLFELRGNVTTGAGPNAVQAEFVGDGSGTGTFRVRFGGGAFPNGGTKFISTPADSVANDAWHHLAIAYGGRTAPNNGYVEVYLDGQSVGRFDGDVVNYMFAAPGSGTLHVMNGHHSFVTSNSNPAMGFNGDMDAILVRSITGTVTPADFALSVPEPSTVALVACGMSVALTRRARGPKR